MMGKIYRLKITIFYLFAGLTFVVLLSTVAVSNTIKLDPSDTMEDVIGKAEQVTPSPQQLAWQQVEFAAFIHFGMNTFTNKEWGDGTEDPKLFNPADLDATQWMRVFKDAGIKMVILTAKHHDGFCLWQSKYTEHSVKNSPWREGRGDVVKEVSDAARKAGIKFGVYLSPWDRHEKTYGTPAYNEYYKNQLRELLTNYGEISEVWMDGACDTEHDVRCGKMRYDLEGIFKLVRELQPNVVIAIIGPDVRWVGNEAGKNRESEWSVAPENADQMAADIGSREKLLEAAKGGANIKWYPAEVDVSIRPGWFYHPMEDYFVKPLNKLLDIYYGAVGGNAQLLLNVPPDRRGLIHKNDAQVLRALGRSLSKTFSENLALHASAKASAVRGGGAEYSADKTVDDDNDTYWTTDDGVTTAAIEYDLGAPRTFNVAMLQEHIKTGQRVEEFYFEVWDGVGWKQVAAATTIGYKRLLRFDTVTAQRVRIRIIRSRVCPTLSNFGLFNSNKK